MNDNDHSNIDVLITTVSKRNVNETKIVEMDKKSSMKHNFRDNRAYPENTNFETVVPRYLKFHTVTSKELRNAENFNLISYIVYELQPPKNTINI